jgi:hypothetical protein
MRHRRASASHKTNSQHVSVRRSCAHTR